MQGIPVESAGRELEPYRGFLHSMPILIPEGLPFSFLNDLPFGIPPEGSNPTPDKETDTEDAEHDPSDDEGSSDSDGSRRNDNASNKRGDSGEGSGGGSSSGPARPTRHWQPGATRSGTTYRMAPLAPVAGGGHTMFVLLSQLFSSLSPCVLHSAEKFAMKSIDSCAVPGILLQMARDGPQHMFHRYGFESLDTSVQTVSRYVALMYQG